ncbi:NAD(P)H-hydrate dehydratase [Nocardia cyriacigeorgica]|uniref:NAD(P)H-hydrate dehydratase n=1 Tax=Nocardia cyriacigeorgica TaxID=135487 RepID=UPI001893433D|nr:NAD(P)H-hydrate dehydratase [Nocardia cyriacigeorgica]MBF6438709.1 NAD(P)H-hydrate dehydratase [Nocardia cyriacigeorgica]MBF6456617.1 NAD(P)H-hydrate dehydratase [Nocardia cyriacigeorgica]MBF6479758.1 NAD(P)H-hydrate dehydratase [Nocardia cyriacigeorgica]MBF6551422.1 NAD(P)H-hydrate dehydratase [Nocardia cyriacigeorgica]
MCSQRGYYPVDAVRAAEAELFTRVAAGVPMRRAAYGLATVVAGELRARTGGVAGRSVTLLVGSGDNGGDALWAGSFLRRRGVSVDAVLLNPERAHAEGLAALRKAGGRVRTDVGRTDLVIDGIVGISGRGSLRPQAAELVARIEAPIVAADLPSGVDPDTGAVDGPAVRAQVTVSFGAYKPVHALNADRCGRIELVPIGLRLPAPELAALEPRDIGARWPVPGAGDDKYSQGVTGVCAGSAAYPGAAVLCTGAAVAATSGMVRYAGSGADQVLAQYPEVVAARNIASTGRVQSWVFGPGSGTDDGAWARMAQILSTDLPVVVDADGLTLLADHPAMVRDRAAPTVLTPHAGEFARLTGHPLGTDRVAAVRELAESWGVTVLLKGRATLVAEPGKAVLVNEAGGSWAATAGAGDVLSGVIGALLAAGREPGWSAAAAARVHALAANLAAADGPAAAPISATPLLHHLRPAISTLRALAS